MLEIFLSDIHFPYEDKSSWNLTLQVIKSLKPDLVFLGGDIVDFYSVSQYDKDPARKLSLQSDLDYTYEELTRLRKVAPNAKIVMLQGNHEHRLDRFLNSKASELSSLNALKLENLLKLDSLKIQYIPNGTRVKIGKLWHLHGNEVAGAGANVAKAKFDRLGSNCIFGHHHKLQSYTKRNYDGEVYGAWSNPCLCALQAEYAHFTDWVLGFSIIEYGKNGEFNVEQVPIIKHGMYAPDAKCFIRGKEYRASIDSMPVNKLAPHVPENPVLYIGGVKSNGEIMLESFSE
jgi:predicted phosphodiesterase